MTDRGDWLQVNSGERFYPLSPRSEEIHAKDIAHALSLLCRYGGHIDRFYSVAEHCVLMSQSVSPEHALSALLHDATEAYVVDVPRPVKRYLPEYSEIEDRLWVVIAQKFGVDLELPTEVVQADSRIIINERNALMKNAEAYWPSIDDFYEPLPIEIQGWQPHVAELKYWLRLGELLTQQAERKLWVVG